MVPQCAYCTETKIENQELKQVRRRENDHAFMRRSQMEKIVESTNGYSSGVARNTHGGDFFPGNISATEARVSQFGGQGERNLPSSHAVYGRPGYQHRGFLRPYGLTIARRRSSGADM